MIVLVRLRIGKGIAVVAENKQLVRDGKSTVNIVRNHYDGYALVLETVNYLVKLGGRRRIETCDRLVKEYMLVSCLLL